MIRIVLAQSRAWDDGGELSGTVAIPQQRGNCFRVPRWDLTRHQLAGPQKSSAMSIGTAVMFVFAYPPSKNGDVSHSRSCGLRS